MACAFCPIPAVRELGFCAVCSLRSPAQSAGGKANEATKKPNREKLRHYSRCYPSVGAGGENEKGRVQFKKELRARGVKTLGELSGHDQAEVAAKVMLKPAEGARE